MTKNNTNNSHIDLQTMLSGNVQFFDKNTIEKTLQDILKQTYLEVTCDQKLLSCTSVSDAVASTASKFRETVIKKLETRF